MPDLDLTFVWQCFETDDSSNWEVRYNPLNPENEQVRLCESAGRYTCEMSIETTRALAAILSAAVDQHDSGRRFEKLPNTKQGEKSNG